MPTHRTRGLAVVVATALLATGCASGRSTARGASPGTSPTTSVGFAPEAVRTTTIPANAMRFRVREAGPASGALVMLLHGFPQSGYEWRTVMPTLAAAGYHVVAPDQRGYSPGARPAGDDRYTLDHLVADTVAIADHYRARRFHLVGHDWGGAVAWAVAGRRPDLVERLTVLSTPHPRALAASLLHSDQAL